MEQISNTLISGFEVYMAGIHCELVNHLNYIREICPYLSKKNLQSSIYRAFCAINIFSRIFSCRHPLLSDQILARLGMPLRTRIIHYRERGISKPS